MPNFLIFCIILILTLVMFQISCIIELFSYAVNMYASLNYIDV